MPDDVGGLRVLAFADEYSPDASGGAERVEREINRRLAAAGAVVHVVSAVNREPHRDAGVDVTAIRSYELSRLTGGYLAPAPAAFGVGARLVRELEPDVLVANTIHYTGCIAAADLSSKHGIPLVVNAHLGPLDHLPTVSRWIAGGYEHTIGRYILRRAKTILAVSEAVRGHVITLGASRSRVLVTPNGVDHERFELPPISADDDPLVVSVGRLAKNKGSHLLVDAIGVLHREGIRCRVAFVGDGPLRADLESRVDELGVRDQVQFVGHVKDPEAWLAKGAIAVRPSYTEGMSLAVLEAMAAGRCIVVSDIGPNRELIRDGSNGLIFECGDVQQLSNALRRAITDGALRGRTARQAQEDSQQYTWDRMAALHGDALVRAMTPDSD